MDANRRDRLEALLKTNSGNLLGPVVRELLDEADRAADAAAEVRRLVEERDQARGLLADARADSDRLAHWVIRFGHTGGDPADVLALHDRMAGV